MRFEVSLMIFYLEDTLLLVKKEKISSCLDKKNISFYEKEKKNKITFLIS